MNRVVLLKVISSQQKLIKLIKTATYHFEKKEHLLILAPDSKAVTFVDNILWKEPLHSFLPHSIAGEDFIVISEQIKNFNGATHFFNLKNEPLQIKDPFKIIYDFEDNSTSEKYDLSQKKYIFYKKQGYTIESL